MTVEWGRSVTPCHFGHFSCSCYLLTYSLHVLVAAALTARVRPDVQVVDVGQSATFLCVISGSPVPSVVWYKDGAPVSADDDARVTLSDDRRQLSVRGVLRQDAGMYQCLVENSDDSEQSSGRLIIGGRCDDMLLARAVIHKSSLEFS